jgi:PTS system beta-glucosides-specific IIC component
MDYKNTANELLKAVGGKDNVTGLTHCMTRLRFVLKNMDNLDDKAIEEIPGVMGVIRKNGLLQVIIGNKVADCYAELQKVGNFSESSGATGKQNPLIVAIDFIAGCVTPTIPAIIAGGLVKVLLVILGPGISNVLPADSSTYILLDILGDAPFYFMPMLVGYAAARKLNTSVPLTLMLAGLLIHPNLVALFGGEDSVSFFGLPLFTGSYTASLIPILLTTLLLKYVEILINKITPAWSKNFLKPLLIAIITAAGALFVAAPLGQILGEGLAFVINWIYNLFPPLAMGLFAGFMPLIVMAGMHHAFNPTLMTGMATVGYDLFILPAMFCSNPAQGAASLAVALKSKKSDIRQVAGTAAVSAFMAGVTEPALYGVTLKYKKPLIAACIGGGLGGILVGIFTLKAYSFSVPSVLSIFSLVSPDGPNPMLNFIYGVICMAVSIIVTFILTLVLYKDPVEATIPAKAAPVKGGTSVIPNPVKGEVVALETVNDPTFSTGVLGKGFAVIPSEGVVVAPFSGKVANIFSTGHAVGLESEDGVELLIHVGLETVELEGKHFKALVKDGDLIVQGQPLIEFDIDGIKAAGYDITTPVIVTNADSFTEIECLAAAGQLDKLQPQLNCVSA